MAARIAIVKTLVAVAWPWIERHVWPHIQKRLAESLMKGFDNLSAQVSDKFHQRSSSRRWEDAKEKEAQAHALAQSADSDAEKDSYEELARVWRHAAEELRIENEELKAQIESLIAQEHKRIEEDLLSDSPKLRKDDKGVIMEFKGRAIALPPPQDFDKKP